MKISHLSKNCLLAAFSTSMFTNLNAATYYVDSQNGNDLNNGTSQSSAWKSLAKVNEFIWSISPGDKILFKRGCAWSGMLRVSKGGTNASPVTFGPYGNDTTISNPRIDAGSSSEGKSASDEVDAAIFITSGDGNPVRGIVIEGFILTNYDLSNVYDGAEGLRSGIRIGFWGQELSNITIRDNKIFNIEGFSNHPSVGSPRGTSLDKTTYNQYREQGAIASFPSTLTNLLVQGNSIHECTGNGIFIWAGSDYGITNTVIQQNFVSNVGADGIVVVNADQPLIQNNSCIRAGNSSPTAERAPGDLGCNGYAVAGIWTRNSRSPLIQHNYCARTRKIKADGYAWDFDTNTTGTAIYQFNYSRDNEGGFSLSSGDATTSTLKKIFRYNTSFNDGSKQGGEGQGFFAGLADYYNNLFVRTDGSGFDFHSTEWPPAEGKYINNIFMSNSSAQYTFADQARRYFSNNLYSGFTPLEPGSNWFSGSPRFQRNLTFHEHVHEFSTAGGSFPPEISTRVYLATEWMSPARDNGMVVPDAGNTDYEGEQVPFNNFLPNQPSLPDIGPDEVTLHLGE